MLANVACMTPSSSSQAGRIDGANEPEAVTESETVSGPTECVEAESEGGLGGCCGAIEDGVLLGKREAGERSVTGRGHCSAVEDGLLLGKREAGERSVTGWGPRIRLLSFVTTKSWDDLGRSFSRLERGCMGTSRAL
jgi:hypothetical protein